MSPIDAAWDRLDRLVAMRRSHAHHTGHGPALDAIQAAAANVEIAWIAGKATDEEVERALTVLADEVAAL